MTKLEFIAAVADEAGFTKTETKKVYDAMTKVIADTVAKNEKIQLTGFGTFELKERAAKAGINPRTKEPIEVPARHVPVLKFGKSFKDEVVALMPKSKKKKK